MTRHEGAALLLIDLLNDFDFPEAESLERWMDGVADATETLRAAADGAGIPVIYVNDHYGEWHSDRERIIDRTRDRSRRPDLVERLRPRPDDYFVIKPHFSGFYATNLSALLPHLGVSRLILTGVATDICLLFTAADAHMRDYELWVPCDATACCSDRRRDWALDILKNSMRAETRSTRDVDLASWAAATPNA